MTEDMTDDDRKQPVREGEREEGDEAGRWPEDAVFSPDEPIVRAEGEIPPDAIYPPDGPLRREESGEGVVTRLNGQDVPSPDKGSGLTWKIRLTADLLEGLARELRERGMEALRVHPESEPLDAMMRSFVAGYLVGQEEGEGRGS